MFVWKMMHFTNPLLVNVFNAVRRDDTDVRNKGVTGHVEELGAACITCRKPVLKKIAVGSHCFRTT